MSTVLAFLQSPFAGLLLGLLVKYLPTLKKFPNAAIPYVNAILALLTGLAGTPATHTAAFVAASASPLSALGSACWSAILSSLMYEVFLRHPIKGVSGGPSQTQAS